MTVHVVCDAHHIRPPGSCSTFICASPRSSMSRNERTSALSELAIAALYLVLLVLMVWGGRQIVVHYQKAEWKEQEKRIAKSKDHFWVMETPAPERTITFWLPETGTHADCFPQMYTRAEALLAAIVLVQDGHFHVTRDGEYGGFRLDEFLDDRNEKGEFWSGLVSRPHYHG